MRPDPGHQLDRISDGADFIWPLRKGPDGMMGNYNKPGEFLRRWSQQVQDELKLLKSADIENRRPSWMPDIDLRQPKPRRGRYSQAIGKK